MLEYLCKFHFHYNLYFHDYHIYFIYVSPLNLNENNLQVPQSSS